MENNPPAFPRTYSESKRGYGDQFYEAQDGMTLLDYFAAHFAPTIMNQFPIQRYSFEVSDKDKEISNHNRRRFIASQSYELAKMFLTVRGNFDKDKGH
jgi:hypothetical protein